MNRLVLLAALFLACAEDRNLPESLPDLAAAIPATTFPAPLSVGVALDAEVRIGCSAAISTATASGGLVVSSGDRRVAGTVFLEGDRTLVFVAAEPFAPDTEYRAEVASSVRDALGRLLREGFAWKFRTGLLAGAQRVAPALVAVAPSPGETNVSVRVQPLLRFSHALDPEFLSEGVKLEDANGAPLDHSVAATDDPRQVLLTPAAPLAVSSSYVLRATTRLRTTDGLRLAAERVWRFTTSDDPTHLAPLDVVTVAPAEGATNVLLRTAVTATFARPIDPASLTPSTFVLESEGVAVPAQVSWDSATRTATLVPEARLAVSTTYRATLAGVRSDEAQPLVAPVTWTFETTADAELGERPRVESSVPAADATEVERNEPVRLTFSKPIDASSVTAASVALSVNGVDVGATRKFEDGDRVLVVTPDAALAFDAVVRVSLSADLVDREGLHLVPVRISFRTQPDRVPPSVLATSPAADATEVPLNAALKVTFSEPIDLAALKVGVFVGAVQAAGRTTYDAPTRTVTFVPTAAFAPQSLVRMTLDDITDLAGNRLATFSYSFRSGGVPDTTAPSFEGLDKATTDGETAVRLSWNAATDLESPTISYLVWFARSPAIIDFSQAPALSTAPGATDVRVTGLVVGATYTFAVRAEDGAANRDTNARSVTVTLPDLTPPSFAGAAAAEPVPGEEALVVRWAAAQDNLTPSEQIRYRVYVVAASGGALGAAAVETAAGATEAKIVASGGEPLVGGRSYVLVVRARDAAGNESTGRIEKTATVADIRPPVLAGAFRASAVARDAVRLEWDAATDLVSASSAIRYRVASREESASTFGSPTDVAAGITTLTVGALTPGVSYRFRLTAVDEAGLETAHATEPVEATDAVPPAFPAAGVGLMAVSPAGGEAQIVWSAATDARSPPVTYRLFRSQVLASLFSSTPEDVGTATGKSLTRLAAGRWFFGVRAQDAVGNRDTNETSTFVDVAAPPLQYQDLVTQVLQPAGCIGCHGFSYATFMDPSARCDGLPFVKLVSTQPRVGDPSQSFLYRKVAPEYDGNRCGGGRMPQGGSLSEAQLAVVRAWIEGGAQQ